MADLYDGVPFDNILKCVHCGLCLNACPTYRSLGTEQDSPRGRLYLMRGLWEGEIPLNDEVLEPISRCLDCRACETACPSKVPYGELLEKTRGVALTYQSQSWVERIMRTIFLKKILVSTDLLVLLSKTAKIYQKSGLHHFGRLLPGFLGKAHHMMPQFSGTSYKKKAFLKQKKLADKPRIALFTGCVMDVAEADIHLATTKVLTALGFQVVVPPLQACCGALAVHAGERETGRTLAKANHAAFSGLDVSAIIVNSAGCGAQLHEYEALFSDTPESEPERWQRFSQEVADILVFLAGQDLSQLKFSKKEETIFYDAPCHLIHAQKQDELPRSVFNAVPGLNLVPLKDSSQCCGAAGIYNLTQTELSASILDRKLDSIEQALVETPEARTLVTGNPGCLFQLRHGIKQRGLSLRVVHPIEVLAERLN